MNAEQQRRKDEVRQRLMTDAAFHAAASQAEQEAVALLGMALRRGERALIRWGAALALLAQEEQAASVAHLDNEPGSGLPGPLCMPAGMQPAGVRATSYNIAVDAYDATCPACQWLHDRLMSPDGVCGLIACTCQGDES